MLKLLEVNIKQFNDEPNFVDEHGGLDVEGIINAYNNQDQSDDFENNSDENEEIETTETETETEIESNPEGEEQQELGDEGEPEPEPEPKPDKRTPDQAFAEMRRKLEATEPIAQWVQQLAEQQGFKDPQELIDAYEQQRLAREAEEKGIPVDVYQRLAKLEEENRLKDEAMFAERFNREVETTKDKYNLSDEQINEVFQFMGQNGYIDEKGRTSIAFEDAYILANRDTLIQQAEERGRQAYLEEKRKKQTQATPVVGTHAKDKDGDDLDYSTESIFKTFEEHGIPID